MKFTFGIITVGNCDSNINKIIDSIEYQNISKDMYEIIIVGNYHFQRKNTKVIEFNEFIKNSWITAKKNIITKNATFENIVFMHDYVFLEENWYNGYLKFGDDWDICMNKIKNADGSRFIDWMGMPDDSVYGNVLLPYDYKGSKGMYISGTYWVVKKKIMERFPLNEDFHWGEGEDIEWSKRVLGGFIPLWLKNRNELLNKKSENCKYVFNPNSAVKFLKFKNMHLNFKNEYDLHSGNEARPLKSISENYYFLKFRNN